jgi:hypothetical protein
MGPAQQPYGAHSRMSVRVEPFTVLELEEALHKLRELEGVRRPASET